MFFGVMIYDVWVCHSNASVHKWIELVIIGLHTCETKDENYIDSSKNKLAIFADKNSFLKYNCHSQLTNCSIWSISKVYQLFLLCSFTFIFFFSLISFVVNSNKCVSIQRIHHSLGYDNQREIMAKFRFNVTLSRSS